jgi:hypothetical protein
MPTEHFKSKQGYNKWNAYRHLHDIPSKMKTAVVAGESHKVQHDKKSNFSRALRKKRMIEEE